jgi:hypothetical protein
VSFSEAWKGWRSIDLESGGVWDLLLFWNDRVVVPCHVLGLFLNAISSLKFISDCKFSKFLFQTTNSLCISGTGRKVKVFWASSHGQGQTTSLTTSEFIHCFHLV